MSTFKPTRKEVQRVRYLAEQCEIDLAATQCLAAQGVRYWYGMHRPAIRASEAFFLSVRVAARVVPA